SSVAFFLLGYYLIGPLVHEAFHVFAVRLLGCFHEVSFGFNALTGFRGSVQPFCYMDSLSLAFFYGGGYLSTLLVGIGVHIYSFYRETVSSNALSLGTGILVSVLATATLSGDLIAFSETAGVREVVGTVTVFVVLTVLLVTLSGWEMHHQKGRNGAETRA
ncbi:MAG: hypothetical protein ABEJ66_03540, partial [Candidatus Nanohaloarchaea archaeon]